MPYELPKVTSLEELSQFVPSSSQKRAEKIIEEINESMQHYALTFGDGEGYKSPSVYFTEKEDDWETRRLVIEHLKKAGWSIITYFPPDAEPLLFPDRSMFKLVHSSIHDKFVHGPTIF